MRQRTARGVSDNLRRGRVKRLRRPKAERQSLLRVLLGVLRREYYLPLPDNKIGKFLNTRRYFLPKYVRGSIEEMRLVTWPTRRETRQLTGAVFIFAIIFGLMAALVDYGLDKVFKELLLK